MLKKQKNQIKLNDGLTTIAIIIIISAIIIVATAIIFIILKTGIFKNNTTDNINIIEQDNSTKINVGGKWYNSMEEYLASDITSSREAPEIYKYSFNVGYKNGQVTRRYNSIHCGN